MPLDVVFMGTPDFAVPTLVAIAAAGHRVLAAYAQPPRPSGRRGLALRLSPVAEAASRLGIPVRHPASLRDPEQQAGFRSLAADVAVVVAYGLLLPARILEAPRLGCYNGHASLLPRWRGAAPIQRAIMAGDAATGMMVMKMDEGLDTGPVALVEPLAIGPDETAGELAGRLATAGAALLVDALARLQEGDLPLTPQAVDGATYAAKIAKAEARIDWRHPAKDVHNRIRGLSPFPGAWCEGSFGAGLERLKVLRSTLAEGEGEPGDLLDGPLTVACGAGAVRLLEVQRPGGRPMGAQDFLRGAKLEEGMRLS